MQSYEDHRYFLIYCRPDDQSGWKLAHGNVRDADHANEVAAELRQAGKRARITETVCRVVSDE